MTWTDKVYLGPAPAEEDCAQVGSADYADRAMRECRAYMAAIRMVCGDEPDGARLRVAREQHDYGSYYEVVCEYDGNNRAAAEYAARCDEQAPTTWEQAGMTAPVETGPQVFSPGDKRYVGVRGDDGVTVTVIDGGRSYPLPLRLDLHNHSPSGFEYGYPGSGPAQLALALLADATGRDNLAQRDYQDFKQKVVARLQGDQWELTAAEVCRFIEEKDRGRLRGQ